MEDAGRGGFWRSDLEKVAWKKKISILIIWGGWALGRFLGGWFGNKNMALSNGNFGVCVDGGDWFSGPKSSPVPKFSIDINCPSTP